MRGLSTDLKGRVLALGAALVFSAAVAAGATPAPAGASGSPASADLKTDFHDVLRASDINYGLNMLGWGRCAVPADLYAINMTGPSNSKSNVWLTNTSGEHHGSMELATDIGIWRNNNRKGGGVAWSWDNAKGTGLAVFALDSKEHDSFMLAKIEHGMATKLVELPMGDALPIHATSDDVKETGIHHIDPTWYRVVVDITSDDATFSVSAKIMNHLTKMDPASALTTQAGPTLTYGPVSFASVGVSPSGEIGLAGHAENTSVNTSFANFFAGTAAFGGTTTAATAPTGSATRNMTTNAAGPDLVVTSASASVGTSGAARLKFTVKNEGAAPAPAGFTTTMSLSKDTSADASDQLLSSYTRTRALAPGASFTVSKVTKPLVVIGGSYYVVTATDAGNAVIEASESNNTRSVGPLQFGQQCAGGDRP